MADIALYMAPGTCARVTAIALEELGLDFETRVVRFRRGEHKSPEYTRLNPKGKVPTLVHHGDILTENVAILSFLDECYGGLNPAVDGAMARARLVSDLCFCAATLHPIVTRIRMPMFFAGEENAVAVKVAGCRAMDEYFQLIEDRLNKHRWWYGEQWAAMDAYLYWVFWRVEGAGYDVNRFPAYTAHARAMEARPAVQRAQAREEIAQAILEKEGLAFSPPEVPLPVES